MKKLIIFTDLDGTLLDYSTYSFKAALPALQLLKERDIPFIICSSKTKKEIEYYRKKIGNNHPFISENGGGIFIPKNYFQFKLQSQNFKVIEENDYQVIRLGAQYSDLRRAIEALRKEGFSIRGFGDMSAKEISEAAGMTTEEAKMAKERDFDEPFIFKGSNAKVKELLQAIEKKGFNVAKGRFFHILGNSDKGKVTSILIDLYKKKYDKVTSIAIGDSPNDIPMLEKVDYPVIVQKFDGSYDTQIDILHLTKADGIGPEGWNKAVLSLLKQKISL
jgi:mannosyl-3-phosphoglycerate phosphatase family protein